MVRCRNSYIANIVYFFECTKLFANFTEEKSNTNYNMAKILGLDLGTNSIGWAITEQQDDNYTLLDKGVDIFQEGVALTKSG